MEKVQKKGNNFRFRCFCARIYFLPTVDQVFIFASLYFLFLHVHVKLLLFRECSMVHLFYDCSDMTGNKLSRLDKTRREEIFPRRAK